MDGRTRAHHNTHFDSHTHHASSQFRFELDCTIWRVAAIIGRSGGIGVETGGYGRKVYRIFENKCIMKNGLYCVAGCDGYAG